MIKNDQTSLVIRNEVLNTMPNHSVQASMAAVCCISVYGNTVALHHMACATEHVFHSWMQALVAESIGREDDYFPWPMMQCVSARSPRLHTGLLFSTCQCVVPLVTCGGIPPFQSTLFRQLPGAVIALIIPFLALFRA